MQMTGGGGSLPPLDVTRAPEGGEIGPVQSGWRLALREFAQNRLAVTGVGILLFFVLFSFVGPAVLSRQLPHLEPAGHQPSARRRVIRSAPTTRGTTSWPSS